MTPSTTYPPWLLLLAFVAAASAFVAPIAFTAPRPTTLLSSPEDAADEGSGADLAAEFFRMAQKKGVGLGADDLLDDEDDEDEEDEEEANYPQGAINAFLGYDTGDVGEKLSGNISLTNDQLYSEVKERVLDTAGGFVDYVKGAREDEDDEDDAKPKEYKPPTTVPDPELTAGEVVMTVLDALNNNDNPAPNRGVEVLFGYSGPGSSIKQEEGLQPAEYKDFLKETEYKVLFEHKEVSIDKGDYSYDGKKAFFTARLKVGEGPLDQVPVNFILSSTEGVSDESCWLVDSMLIRPQSMRRRRRK